VTFEVLTAVVMRVAIFWDIASCSPYINQRFRGKVLALWFLARLIFDPEGEGDTFPRNVGSYRDYTAL
jgi:hypothetical protein